MSNEHDDKMMQAASKLATEIRPERDLWPGIEEAIAAPKRSRWTPMLAQAAAVVLLVGASSMVTYSVVKQDTKVVEITRPTLAVEQATFGDRAMLGQEYDDARVSVASALERELERMSPETRADVEHNLAVIRQAIADIGQALEAEPDNRLLQDLLVDAYREELLIMQRVGSLTQRVMPRQDI